MNAYNSLSSIKNMREFPYSFYDRYWDFTPSKFFEIHLPFEKMSSAEDLIQAFDDFISERTEEERMVFEKRYKDRLSFYKIADMKGSGSPTRYEQIHSRVMKLALHDRDSYIVLNYGKPVLELVRSWSDDEKVACGYYSEQEIRKIRTDEYAALMKNDPASLKSREVADSFPLYALDLGDSFLHSLNVNGFHTVGQILELKDISPLYSIRFVSRIKAEKLIDYLDRCGFDVEHLKSQKEEVNIPEPKPLTPSLMMKKLSPESQRKVEKMIIDLYNRENKLS